MPPVPRCSAERAVGLDVVLDRAAVAGDDQATAFEELRRQLFEALNAGPDGAFRDGHLNRA